MLYINDSGLPEYDIEQWSAGRYVPEGPIEIPFYMLDKEDTGDFQEVGFPGSSPLNAIKVRN